MGKFNQQLSRLKVELKNAYNPNTAFGDPVLVEIHERISKLEQEMDGKEECDACDGWGIKECYECGSDTDCQECDGTGLVESQSLCSPSMTEYDSLGMNLKARSTRRSLPTHITRK